MVPLEREGAPLALELASETERERESQRDSNRLWAQHRGMARNFLDVLRACATRADPLAKTPL